MTNYERIVGSLYGMAIGDALGVPTSFMTQEYIKKTWGWVSTFYPPEKGHIYHDGLKAGEYTDDTEQALALLNSFIRNNRVVKEDVVKEILGWAERVKDKYASPLGPSTERALKSIKSGGDITQSGRYSNTNGAAMRISPIGMIHGVLGSSCEDMVRDVYMTCIPTHNTTVCVASAAAIAWGVALCVRGETNLDVIIDECKKAADIGANYGYPIVSPSISKRIDSVISLVKKHRSDPENAMKKLYEEFGGGDLAADSIPVSLGLFVLGDGKVKEVLEYCVNFGGDCDTNAAMAGAMAGALEGKQNIPEEWSNTIQKVNNIDLEMYASKLIELIPNWNTATIEDVQRGK